MYPRQLCAKLPSCTMNDNSSRRSSRVASAIATASSSPIPSSATAFAGSRPKQPNTSPKFGRGSASSNAMASASKKIITSSPGYMIYEDEWQIVAEPARKATPDRNRKLATESLPPKPPRSFSVSSVVKGLSPLCVLGGLCGEKHSADPLTRCQFAHTLPGTGNRQLKTTFCAGN